MRVFAVLALQCLHCSVPLDAVQWYSVQTLTAAQFLPTFRVSVTAMYFLKTKNPGSDVSETVSPSCAVKQLIAAGAKGRQASCISEPTRLACVQYFNHLVVPNPGHRLDYLASLCPI